MVEESVHRELKVETAVAFVPGTQRGRGALIYPKVEVLMSVHNGERFLRGQLDSLLNQTYVNWHLSVRDDNSVDSSFSIVEEYQRRYPEKVSILANDRVQLGACQSFGVLLSNAEADYIMFCDQDDVWLPEKIERSLNEIRCLEKSNPGKPALVFTDLSVVDQNLRQRSDSFWNYQRINPSDNSLNLLIADNVATGCTMIFNRKLKIISTPIPVDAIMHDWWLTLICSTYGSMSFLRDPTVLYRQHGMNDTGAVDFSTAARSKRFIGSPLGVLMRSTSKAALVRRQAGELLKRTREYPPPDAKVTIPLSRFCASTGFIQRKWCLIHYRMLSRNYIKALKQLLFL